jgi:tRNA nucleotidyltransferase (CCA-adding enzyme)
MGLVEQLRTTEIKSMCEKFMFRKGEEKRILSYKKIKRNFILTLRKNDSKPARIYSLLEPLSYEEIILLKAKYRNQNIQRHIIDFLKMYNGIRIHVSGHDLRGLGIAPGPQYQKIFGRVLEAKLNGRVKTKDDELNLIRGLMQRR